MKNKSRIAVFLERAPDVTFAIYAATAAFCTYFCMYAFRKPFAAGAYEGVQFFGTEIELKTAFVISQLIGYTISKFLGLKYCSEAISRTRGKLLIGLIIVAEVALLGFAVVPGEWKAFALLLNGLPLGMVWGVVVSYLEGRRSSDLLMAGLSTSFIVASGMVKDIGRWLMNSYGVGEYWMPFTVGALFLPLFCLSVWAMEQLPKPTAEDVKSRSKRTAMSAEARWAFVKKFAFGLVTLVVFYVMLSAFRDYRDNYGIEMFAELGYSDEPALFSKSELPVAFGVMIAMAALNIIKDHRRGFFGALMLMGAGAVLIGVSTMLQQNGTISGMSWMILTGLGSYLAYVPFNSVLFERLMAYTRFTGTAVFAIYIADSMGYLGSVSMQLYKDLLESGSSKLEFFQSYSYLTSISGVLLLGISALYFAKRRDETE
jgi:hypothetical protein